MRKESVTKFRFEQMADSNVYKLYIYDNVTAYGDFNWETWDYEDAETSANYFRTQLSEIPDTAEIELHVNSYGGDVKEGIAIYNLLKQHEAHKTCYVDGFAYSIASVICLACDKIIMGLGTSMLIHNMSMYVNGNAETLRKCADDLDILMESNRQIYMVRAKNITEEELKDMMDKETYLTPEQCLEYGFCDEIGTQQADQNLLNQSAAKKVIQLRQQINNMKSFRQEMENYTSIAPAQQKQGEGMEKNKEEAVLKMMSAFFNAFQK
ncbi:MAG: Clp protease ClpP [Lachnospiraceae bacterium]|nr:Clp protease ClpP [Lachnospiraceae bacterium]